MRVGQKVIFHHIAKSAGTSMVNLLRRNYPHGGLLEVYDRRDAPAPEPTPKAFARYLASFEPEQWDKIRCLTGHSINYAIPVLNDPCQVFTIVRDPVDRAVSLYHYLRGREGFGETGGVAGELIREHDWSLADIYRTFGGSHPNEDGEHRLFADFFNGQARAVLAPHFPVNFIPMTDGEPDAPAALETLECVISEHYLLGSASRYEESVQRFAAEFDWSDTTIMRENITPDRPAVEELPDDLVEMIRAYNVLDEELHLRALAELVGIPDLAHPSVPNGRKRPPSDPTREIEDLTVKVRAREHALARTEQALERTERAHERTGQALSRADQARRDLEARLERHERELGEKVRLHERGLARLRAELARVQGLLAEERSEHNHLRGVSAARDSRLHELAEQLAEREQETASARRQVQELTARAQQHDDELARLREDNAHLEGALSQERTEQSRLRGATAARESRRQEVGRQVAERLATRERELAAARRLTHELAAKVADQEGELARLGDELADRARALNEVRTEYHVLRGASDARDARLEAIGEQLGARADALAEARQAHRALEARTERRERELADLRKLLSSLLRAGREVAGDLGLATSDAADGPPEPAAAMLEATLERAHQTLVSTTEERRRLAEDLDGQSVELEQALARQRRLAATVAELERALADVRAEAEQSATGLAGLIEERRAMTDQARSLVRSRAWRYGHGASRVLRRITLRPSKAPAGAADELLAMLETPPQLPAPKRSAR